MKTHSEVILVHGLWFGSWAMASLDKKLRARGFTVRRFDYASTAGGLPAHAAQLREFARASQSDQLHFVGHSLGGLVTLRMLSEPGASGKFPPGRIVLMGSPLDGSGVVRRSVKVPGAEKLLGEIRSALEQGYERLPGGRETGMIAGSRSIGLGVFVGGAGKPGDGTVGVNETRSKGLKEHIVLPVTHTGMLYSKKVARQAACFLKRGSFDRAM
jgi:pimeloyl-ACP methyl ester carboxylesterase